MAQAAANMTVDPEELVSSPPLPHPFSQFRCPFALPSTCRVNKLMRVPSVEKRPGETDREHDDGSSGRKPDVISIRGEGRTLRGGMKRDKVRGLLGISGMGRQNQAECTCRMRTCHPAKGPCGGPMYWRENRLHALY